MVYHLKTEPDMADKTQHKFKRGDIEPICFLFKTLTAAERRYWPRELEVACLVWAVGKLRHMINESKCSRPSRTQQHKH